MVVDLSRERFRGPRWSDCFERLVSPALERLLLRCRGQAVAAHTFGFGTAPGSPEVSIVTPLYGRIDLVEHQIAQLADDPATATAELLFVLDSPELTEDFERTAFHLSRLYQLPIRGVVAPRHLGYAGATNLGTVHARGRLLLLLHSDIFPDRPGWIGTLASFYRGERRIGAVGPKLLYEDRSLQHAGVTFSRDLEPDGLWSSIHRLKGLPRHHPEASEARTVPAVSGACLMISRQLFEDLGGLRDSYVAGDLEDVDLCLRCLARERESWYLPAAELFHLEGQSRQPGSGWRRSPEAALYNRWLLSRRWGGRLETISESASHPTLTALDPP
jgi:GT2 family glycosyltransferase